MSDQIKSTSSITSNESLAAPVPKKVDFTHAIYNMTIGGVILAESEWLQKTPRTTFEILLEIFPCEVKSLKDVPEMCAIIEKHLRSAGYFPHPEREAMEVKWNKGVARSIRKSPPDTQDYYKRINRRYQERMGVTVHHT